MSTNDIPIDSKLTESSRADLPVESPGGTPSTNPIESPVETPAPEPSDDKPESESTESNNETFCNLISDINSSKQLNNILTGCGNIENACSDFSISSTIDKSADTLKNINSIKDELCKLPLDTCENQYITNNVFPLVNILYLLSTTSLNLSTSVNYLTVSSIVHPKKSELKDTIHLIYKINDECDDLYDLVKKKLKVLPNY